jgi:LysR family transcriptional activator of dmlA
MRRHPEHDVQLELLDRSVELIGEGFDLDIRVGPGREANLLVQRLAHNWRILCASPAYLARAGTPVRLSDLTHHRCIVIRERDRSGPWRLTGPNGSETAKVPMTVSANSGEVVHQWGVDGHGIFCARSGMSQPVQRPLKPIDRQHRRRRGGRLTGPAAMNEALPSHTT